MLLILAGNEVYPQTMILDSTWTVKKTKYKVHLSGNNETKNELNTLITIYRGNKEILTDSLYTSRLYIELRDMNSDGFTDLLPTMSPGQGQMRPLMFSFSGRQILVTGK